MKQLSQTKQFLRDIKRMNKQGKSIGRLRAVVQQLAEGKPLDAKHHDHPLVGRWKNSRDCHIDPDWVLIYTSDATSLRLERTGTHSDLFRK